MISIFFLLSIILIIILIFSSKKFSPIPYFPSNNKDLARIIDVLDLKKNQTLVDLGAGDGIIIFASAENTYRKKLNTKFVAVEINPVLITILYLKRFFHPNKKNIKIIWGDIFKIKYLNLKFKNKYLTFYLYISPWYLNKISKKIMEEIPKAKIISYMYPIKILIDKEKTILGKNKIYYYP